MPDTFPLSSIKQDRINLLIKMAHCTYIYNIYLSSLSFFNSTCTINPVYTTMGTVLINFKNYPAGRMKYIEFFFIELIF